MGATQGRERERRQGPGQDRDGYKKILVGRETAGEKQRDKEKDGRNAIETDTLKDTERWTDVGTGWATVKQRERGRGREEKQRGQQMHTDGEEGRERGRQGDREVQRNRGRLHGSPRQREKETKAGSQGDRDLEWEKREGGEGLGRGGREEGEGLGRGGRGSC